MFLGFIYCLQRKQQTSPQQMLCEQTFQNFYLEFVVEGDATAIWPISGDISRRGIPAAQKA